MRDTAGRTDASARRAADDDRLVAAARDGDAGALDALLTRYRGLVRSRARAYFLVGGDGDDLVQEGMIGLYKAVRDYRSEEAASFRSFAELCVTRQILTAIKTATRQKHGPLNSYVSLDRPVDHEPGRTIADRVAVDPDPDPLATVVQGDQLAQMRELFDEVLSDLEEDVLLLYAEGRTYQEIAELLGRRVKSIDNALQRIKRKLESHLHDAAVTSV